MVDPHDQRHTLSQTQCLSEDRADTAARTDFALNCQFSRLRYAMSEPTLRQAGATVIILVIVVKIVGFAREAVIAGVYGTTRVVDTYLAAITIPAIFTNLVYQALPNAFVPLFAPGNASARSRRLAIQLLVISFGVSILLWLTAPWLASVTNSGFSPELKRQTINLIRIAAGGVLLATFEALGRSRLIAQRRFVQSGLSQLWSSVTVIIAVVLFMDAGAYALMWGLVIGIGVIGIWNVLPLSHRPQAPTAAADAQEPSVTDGSWVAVVVLLTVIASFNGLIDRHLGSYLEAGSLAALQYANLIATQPVAVCGITIATAIFPYLTQKLAAGDHDGTMSVLDRAVRWAMLGGIPSAVMVIVFAPEILRILLERGEFDMQSRAMTGSALAVYGFWMIPAVVSAVVAKVHYSARGVRELVWATVVGLVIKVGASFWWVEPFGIAGLAGSSAATLTAYLIILTVALPGWLKFPLWK
ncbi:MAG: hypothetical protein GF341_10695, partial [candidate division Zixibacteria bacterium]|nr:hypothetical protein [candidate division Zixibacteria bacterium]